MILCNLFHTRGHSFLPKYCATDLLLVSLSDVMQRNVTMSLSRDDDLHWLPVHQRIIFRTAMLVNKCMLAWSGAIIHHT